MVAHEKVLVAVQNRGIGLIALVEDPVDLLERLRLLHIAILLDVELQPLQLQVPQVLESGLDVLVLLQRHQSLLLRLYHLLADSATAPLLAVPLNLPQVLLIVQLLPHLQKHVATLNFEGLVLFSDLVDVVWQGARLHVLNPLALLQTLLEILKHLVQIVGSQKRP